jgi:hypothetical protein
LDSGLTQNVARENIINQLDIFLTRRFQSGSCVAAIFSCAVHLAVEPRRHPKKHIKAHIFAQIKGFNREGQFRMFKVNSLFKSISPLIFKMPFIWRLDIEKIVALFPRLLSAPLKIFRSLGLGLGSLT